MHKFKILEKLGEGAFSKVYKVQRLTDEHEYALKMVKVKSLDHKEVENALNEVRLLASINNPFISRYKEAFFDKDSECLCIIMEYSNDGDLLQRIHYH
jgi:NIMA (never in mitosis gene a)-related kinase